MHASFPDLAPDVNVEPPGNMAWPPEFWLRMLQVNSVPRSISRVRLKLTGKGRGPVIQAVRSWQKAFQTLATKGNGNAPLERPVCHNFALKVVRAQVLSS
jgi:hypothetical protein